MYFDNVVIHYMPGSPLIAKCLVNLKRGKKIVNRFVIKDPAAAYNWINSRCPGTKSRLIYHNV